MQLPSLKELKWKIKDSTIGPPIIQLYSKIRTIIKPESMPNEKLDPGSLLFHPSDFRVIHKLNQKWIRYNYPFLTTYRQQSDLDWLYLDIGPRFVDKDAVPKWLHHSKFRIRTPKL